MGLRFNARTSAIETDAASIDFTQPITTPASTTSLAGLNIAEGVAPTTPVDGDVWVTAAGAFNARLNGATVDLSAGGGGTPTAITVANEATDTTCFPSFFTAATGDLGPKTNAGLTFNSSTGQLAATTFLSSSLTNNDVLVAGTSGVIEDSAGLLTFSGTDLVVGSTSSAVAHSVAAQENSGGIAMRILTDGSGRISQLSAAGAVEDEWISMTRNAGVALKYNNVNHIFTVSGGVQIDDSIYMAEKAAANADTATLGQIWVRTATPNELYFTTDAGDDIQITTGTGLAAGNVSNTGTPVNNQIAVWTDATTIEGAANVTYDGIAFEVSTDVLRVTGGGSSFQNNSGTASVTLTQNWNGTSHEFTFGSAATNWRIEGLTNAAGDSITIADGPEIRINDPTDSQYLTITKGSTATTTINASSSQTITLGANISTLLCEDTVVDQPVLRDYAIEAPATFTPTGTTQTLTYSQGNAFDVDLESVSGNITITISGGPPSGTYGQIVVKITQDSTVARTVSWAGGTFRWAGGSAHPMNTTLNGFSIYTFETWDTGTTWWGAGADYS